jgi:hypothetical protein
MGGVMKRVLVSLVVLLVTLSACKPDKPWSPDDPQDLNDEDLATAPLVVNVEEKTNIGDAEQGLWIEARLTPEAITPGMVNDEIENRRSRLAIVNVTIPPPVPETLHAIYTVNATREFEKTPVVLRAQVMVDGMPVGSIQDVFGINAREKKLQVTVDLFSAFEQIPDSILATVEGELLLMPEGTDESSIDPATATSTATSKAIQFNPIRVNIERGAAAVESLPQESGEDAGAIGEETAAPDSPDSDAAPETSEPESDSEPAGSDQETPAEADPAPTS